MSLLIHYILQLFRFGILCFKSFILVLYVFKLYRHRRQWMMFDQLGRSESFFNEMHRLTPFCTVRLRSTLLQMSDVKFSTSWPQDRGGLVRRSYKESHCDFLVQIWISQQFRIMFLSFVEDNFCSNLPYICFQ